jgi:hypothetical protein
MEETMEDDEDQADQADQVADLRDRVQGIAKRIFLALDREDLDNLDLCALSVGLTALQLLRLNKTSQRGMKAYLEVLSQECKQLDEWVDADNLATWKDLVAVATPSTAIH